MPLTIEQMRKNKKTGYKPPSEIDRNVAKSKTRVVKPKSSVRGTVLTGPEARSMQDKQSKKKYKNPKNTTSSSRYT